MAGQVVEVTSASGSGHAVDVSFADGSTYGVFATQDSWTGTLGSEYTWSAANLPYVNVYDTATTRTINWGGEADGTHNQFSLYKNGVIIAVGTHVTYNTVTGTVLGAANFKLESGSFDVELVPNGLAGIEAGIPPHSHLHIGLNLVDGLYDEGDSTPVLQGAGGMTISTAERTGFTIAGWETSTNTRGTVDWSPDHTKLVFTYESGYFGPATFTYQIAYGEEVIDHAATVTITPNPDDGPPLEVTSLELQDDTGIAGDLITSDATVQWAVNWQSSTLVHVALPEFELQFDINQDGIADFTLNAATQLGSVDLAQHGIEDGPVHIKVRAKYRVESQNQLRLGPWKELAFVYGQDSTLQMMLKDSIALSNEQGSGTFLISTSRDADEISGYWLDVDNDGDFDVALQHNATINGGVETDVDLRQVLGDEFSRIAQNGSYPVSILVKDATGTYKKFATTLTVADATPIISFSTSDESIRGGKSFSFMVNYEDAGPDPLQSVLIDWGDDSTTTLSPSVANATSVQGTHTYSESGAYWVTITVSNNDGNFETSYLILADESDEEAPTNAPHLVEAYADVDVNGNATIVIQAVGASGELGVTMAWDLDGGGAFDDDTGAQVSIQDDPNQHVFRAAVRLTGSDGHETIEMFEFHNPF